MFCKIRCRQLNFELLQSTFRPILKECLLLDNNMYLLDDSGLAESGTMSHYGKNWEIKSTLAGEAEGDN